MELFLQRVVDGVSSGAIYAAMALAIVLVYRTTSIVNFAQGEMAMVSVYVAWGLAEAGLPVWGAIGVSMALAFVGGALIERLIIRPVGDAESKPLAIVIVTIGLFVALNGLAQYSWGTSAKTFPRPFPDDIYRPVAGVGVSANTLGILVTLAVVIVLLWLLFQKTKVGLAMRAVASTRESSALVGVRVSVMLMAGWGLAAAIGALGGALWAGSLAGFDTNLMQVVLIYAFAAATLGGFDSPVGAVVGGVAVGVIENLAAGYVGFVGSDLAIGTAFLLILVVLLVRPRGLFGRTQVARV